MNELTSLEKQVIEMLLNGEDDFLSILRQQADQIKVSSRKNTGVGFCTEFIIPSETPRLAGRPSFKLGDVNGTAKNVKYGMGFLLFIRDGSLKMLEGYTYDEPWPNEVEELSLTYSGGKSRNMVELSKAIQNLTR